MSNNHIKVELHIAAVQEEFDDLRLILFKLKQTIGAPEQFVKNIQALDKQFTKIRKEFESTASPLLLFKLSQITTELNQISEQIGQLKHILNLCGASYIFISNSVARDTATILTFVQNLPNLWNP